jgi:hypothetical protein
MPVKKTKRLFKGFAVTWVWARLYQLMPSSEDVAFIALSPLFKRPDFEDE